MDKFWKLFEESVIVQAIITLALVVTTCILVGQGKPVPELLASGLMLVLGFYFGSKTQQMINRSRRES
jgi:hypothetical protein